MRKLLVVVAAAAMLAAAGGCAQRAVAKVDGDIITEREFYDRLEEVAGQQVLDQLILEHLFAQKAKEKGVQVTEQEVNQAFADIRQRWGDQWQQLLERSGQTEEKIKRQLRQGLLRTKVVFPEREIREYYEQNRTRFDEPARAKYRRIVVKTKQEAQQLRQELLSGRLDFAQAVRERSQDAEGIKQRGGEMPVATQGYVEPALAGPLFTLKVGEISEPLETTYPRGMYQIIQVLERTEAKRHTYDEVKARVMDSLMAMRNEEVGRFMQDLRAAATVTIFRPRYQRLAEQYAKLKERKPPAIEVPTGGPRPGAAPPGKSEPPRPRPGAAPPQEKAGQ